jgi:hypothetical protein
MAKRYSYNPFDTIAENMGKNQKERKAYKKAFRSGRFDFTFQFGSLGFGTKFEDIKAGNVKGFGGRTVFTLKELDDGIAELQVLLLDKKIIFAVVKSAYDRAILPVIKKRLKERSMKRKGGGSGFFMKTTAESDEEGDESKPIKKGNFQSRGDELGDKWRQVYDILMSSVKEISPGIYGSFSMEDVMAIEMEQYSVKAKFRNVYMMAEFGTGHSADPGPRLFNSKKNTPFKLWPALVAKYGGHTSWWFTFHSSIGFAEHALRSLQSSRKNKKKKKKPLDTSKIYSFAFGRKKHPRSIQPRHVIFDARGMVLQLRKAYQRAYAIIAQELEQLIREKVPFWPKGIIVFKVGEPKFDFSKATKKV